MCKTVSSLRDHTEDIGVRFCRLTANKSRRSCEFENEITFRVSIVLRGGPKKLSNGSAREITTQGLDENRAPARHNIVDQDLQATVCEEESSYRVVLA